MIYDLTRVLKSFEKINAYVIVGVSFWRKIPPTPVASRSLLFSGEWDYVWEITIEDVVAFGVRRSAGKKVSTRCFHVSKLSHRLNFVLLERRCVYTHLRIYIYTSGCEILVHWQKRIQLAGSTCCASDVSLAINFTGIYLDAQERDNCWTPRRGQRLFVESCRHESANLLPWRMGTAVTTLRIINSNYNITRVRILIRLIYIKFTSNGKIIINYS